MDGAKSAVYMDVPIVINHGRGPVEDDFKKCRRHL